MQFPDLNQLFRGFTQQESLLFMAFLIIAFLIGLLFGYALRSRRVRELRRELKKKEADIQQRNEKIEQLTNELSLKEADLKKALYQQEEANERAQRLQVEQGKLSNQVTYLRDELDKERAAAEGWQSTVDDLNDQILGLKTKLAQAPQMHSGSEEKPEMTQRLAAVENRVQQLERENARLEEQLQSLQTHEAAILEGPVPPFSPTAPEEEPENLPDDNDQSAILDQDRAFLRQTEKDDLTQIDGIGPFLEKKLNDAGVVSYDQISNWTEADIARITQEIQFFEGRIEKDNWVGQAQRLAQQKSGANNTQKPNQESPADEVIADNLQLIEGIGPRIESILHNRDVHTFSDLAQADPKQIRNWLEEVDPSLLMHDPATWPAQARLAANEQWEVLKDYQDQLRAGRE